MVNVIAKSNPSLSSLASHLVNDGLLSMDIAQKTDQDAKLHHSLLVTYLVKQHILSSETILQSCARTFSLPIFDLNIFEKSWLSTLNLELLKQYHFVPLKKEDTLINIGVSDPTDRQVIEVVGFYTGLRVCPWLVDEAKLTHLLHSAIHHSAHKSFELSLLNELAEKENTLSIQENSVTYDEPVIRFVDHIIHHALQQSSSDIHIEPYETICRIRYRKDGLLYEVSDIPIKMAARLATRLKVMSRLDIAERRLPQDGRFQLHNIDIRINTCPTLFGEKIVLRLLDGNKSTLSIPDLGLTAHQQQLFKEKISQPQGLILVTGPTGSGKTVTLYSAINCLNTADKNISTVEDPIEIKLAGINQVNINPKIHLNFATILRTFLRQDPDIIMVGEIRDLETAEIAIQAAQTGHLVLSTLHTNGAIETISRLQTMGIPRYNIVSALSLIIAQRLIRKLCDACKQPDVLPDTLLKKMGFDSPIIYKAIGCQHCLNGYQGRIGIYELLSITPSLVSHILSGADTATLYQKAKQENFINLFTSGLQKVNEGVTSLSEVNRVATQ